MVRIALASLAVMMLIPASFARPKLELYKEYPEKNETRQFQAFAKRIQELQAKQAAGGAVHRGFHAKHHGCVKAELEVLPKLPDFAKFGVFAEEKTYTAWVRFSNGVGKVQDDKEKDVRGVAIKLVGVQGPGKKLLADEKETQDFLMTNKPTGTTPDAKTFMAFAEASAGGTASMALFFARHPVIAYELLKTASRKVPSVLTEQYWTGVPFRMGFRAAKFFIRPCTTLTKRYPWRPRPDFLREDLQTHLASQAACFNFYVQYQTDPYKTPIENAFVEWTEADAPPVRIAQLRIPKQSFSSAAQNLFCEQLSFSPWHALEAHQPLGNMNRARKFVYEASAEYRRNQPHVEPTGREVFR